MSRAFSVEPSTITDPRLIGDIILRLAHTCPWRLPLYEAVLLRALLLIEVTRSGAGIEVCFRRVQNSGRSAIFIAGDDDAAPTGPSGFRAAKLCLDFSAEVVVHAAGGKPEHYRDIVQQSAVCKRLLLVETDAAHEAEWVAFAGNKLAWLITTGGKPHPADTIARGSA